jgi:hypothetical protein
MQAWAGAEESCNTRQALKGQHLRARKLPCPALHAPRPGLGTASSEQAAGEKNARQRCALQLNNSKGLPHLCAPAARLGTHVQEVLPAAAALL